MQDTPRRVRPPPNHTLISVACDSRGVHTLYVTQNQLHYMLFNLDTGKFHHNSRFSELSSKYLIKQGGVIQLIPVNLSLGVVMDEHGGIFPISRNNIGNIRDLQLLVSSVLSGKGSSHAFPCLWCMQNLPPVSCVSVGVCSTRNSFVGVVAKKQVLMPAILRCDVSSVQNLLDQLKGELHSSLLPPPKSLHCVFSFAASFLSFSLPFLLPLLPSLSPSFPFSSLPIIFMVSLPSLSPFLLLSPSFSSPS